MIVSFLIPTRNHAPWIRRCIDACLTQRIDHKEVIVVDGASADETPDILRSYGNAIHFISEPDQGQSDALNKALALATGDIIAWINSDDDYPHDRVLAEVHDAFEADPQLDIIYGDGQIVDLEGNVLRNVKIRPLVSPRDLLTRPFCPLFQPAVFFRRSLIERLGQLDTNLHYAMDYDLWLRLFPLARKTRYLPRTLACLSMHPQAKTHRAIWQSVAETINVRNRHAAAADLSLTDRLSIRRGNLILQAYRLAIRLRLWRIAGV